MSATEALKIKKALSNAKKLSAQRRFDEAIDIYNSILRQQPHNSAAKKNLSKLIKKIPPGSEANRAPSNPSQQQIDALINLYNTGQMQEAARTARNLLGAFPNTLMLYNIYGAILVEQGKAQESHGVFEQAIALKPDYAEAHGNLGNILHRLGRLEKALQSYNRAIELKPDHAVFYANRGNVFVDSGHPEKALEDFEKALDLNQDFIEAYFSYANVLRDQGQFEKSLTNYDRCIELNPDYVEAHVNRANTLRQQGRLEDAIISYRNAIQLSPDNAPANINLGNILLNQGKFKEAIEIARKIYDKDPDNKEALACLIGALNYCPPEEAGEGSLTRVQENLRTIEPKSMESPIISDESVRNLYQQCYAELSASGLSQKNYTPTQIWRGEAYYQGCDRHFVVFNKFNAIPEYCFGCYKVYVEPRSVVELFKLMIVFDSIRLPNDKTRKCMVEIRPKISGAYKGYIYCQGHDEGEQILEKVRQVVAERISDDVLVTIKRGCSEYALSYPEYIQTDEKGRSVMSYREEWHEHEEYADKNLVKHIYPPVLDSYNHAGLTLRDGLIMHNWLAYAAAIGDRSYLEISEAPVEKLRIEKRPKFQSA